jgi:hypothetical protein
METQTKTATMELKRIEIRDNDRTDTTVFYVGTDLAAVSVEIRFHTDRGLDYGPFVIHTAYRTYVEQTCTHKCDMIQCGQCYSDMSFVAGEELLSVFRTEGEEGLRLELERRFRKNVPVQYPFMGEGI